MVGGMVGMRPRRRCGRRERDAGWRGGWRGAGPLWRRWWKRGRRCTSACEPGVLFAPGTFKDSVRVVTFDTDGVDGDDSFIIANDGNVQDQIYIKGVRPSDNIPPLEVGDASRVVSSKGEAYAVVHQYDRYDGVVRAVASRWPFAAS